MSGASGMVIVSGHLRVAVADRERYLVDCVAVVEQARAADGCLDFVLGADLVDPGRINILERWRSRTDVEAFRGDGTSGEQAAAILAASVAEYDVAGVRPLG